VPNVYVEKVFVLIYDENDPSVDLKTFDTEKEAAAYIKDLIAEEDEDSSLKALIFKGQQLFLSTGGQKYLMGSEGPIALFSTPDPTKLEVSNEGWLVDG
jgi:hypothetical protein